MMDEDQNNISNLIKLINETIGWLKGRASEFGARSDDNDRKDYVFRNNTSREALELANGAYFGFISPEEDPSGPYHDLSLVIFPGSRLENEWLVALGIGTLGYKNDFELSVIPGVRRSFLEIINLDKGFIKSSLVDMESKLPLEFTQKIPFLANTIKTYGTLLPVCEIIDPKQEQGKEKLLAFLAIYATLRQWATNNSHRNKIQKAIEKCSQKNLIDDEKEVFNLLSNRKYVVLQGAPGTGKTRLAQMLAERLNAHVFFTQFHAETSYSDFIYGIKPDISHDTLKYTENKGVFYQAIEYAISNKDKNTLLIIDEINRANLANILGPIFYLFEYDSDLHNIPITIGGNFEVSKIPENFFVVATMNTADRSLAMVDFALRRRFAWYTLYPKILTANLSDGRKFFADEFVALDKIFQWYAKPEELVFQPGHSYFIARTKEEMENRLRYELLPLINEYLAEGILLTAKEDLIHYFRERLGGEIVQ